jgi:glycopeptide antibiotics resistance protein
VNLDDFQPVSDAPDAIHSDKRRAWIYVGLMMICILLTLPTTPILWKWATENLGKWVNDIGYLLFLVLFAGAGFHAGRRFSGSNKRALLLLSGFALVYFYLLKYHCQFPAERLHLVEYGLLAYLVYRALRLYLPSAEAYVVGFLIASAFGLLDEFIQYKLPNRVFETRDVMTNVLAAGLGLLVVRTIINPDPITDRSTDT